jgi:Ca2+-binding EF-hand superfamily protein
MKHLATSAIAFAALVCTQSLLAQPNRPSFDSLDVDGSGALSKDELRESISRRARQRPADRADETDTPDSERASAMIDRIFATLDTDGDGSVSREEFQARPGRPDRRRRDAEPDAV